MACTMPTIEQQQKYWSRWNSGLRSEDDLPEVSRRQGSIVRGWLGDLRRPDLRILEIGCGTAWLTPSLAAFGTVTAVDLTEALLAKARARYPSIEFVTGDFGALEFGGQFDVIVALEVLSHVVDQAAFVAKAARLLKPGGQLMLTTQNRPVLEHYNRLPPVDPGQYRNWVDKDDLSKLLLPDFDVLELYSVTPKSNRGPMRLVVSSKIHAALSVVAGTKPRDFLERHWLGWTLMARAQKRTTSTRVSARF